jgi:hypothetical protein
MTDFDDCGPISGMNEWQGKRKYSEETCPSSALFITDPTLQDPGPNTDRRGEKPATDLLTYDTATRNIISSTLRQVQLE